MILAFTFFDNAPSMGVWLGLFYVLTISITTWQANRSGDPYKIADYRRALSLTFSIFLLVFVAFAGASYNIGALLELYDPKKVGQYAWPSGRVELFKPVVAVILTVTLMKMWRIVWPSTKLLRGHQLSLRVADLLAGMAVLGAATIWPAKIGVLYALMLWVSLFALNRLNRRYDVVDETINS